MNQERSKHGVYAQGEGAAAEDHTGYNSATAGINVGGDAAARRVTVQECQGRTRHVAAAWQGTQRPQRTTQETGGCCAAVDNTETHR